MGVPKRRHSRSRTGLRRDHQSLKAAQMPACSRCGQPKRPHQVCLNCGYYAGREILKAKKP